MELGRAVLRRRTTCWDFWLPLLSGLILISAESEELSNRENVSSRDHTVSCDLKFVIFQFNLCSTKKKYILEKTIDNKQCIVIIRGKSIVVSSRIWSGIHIITVWHAVYFSFYNKAKGLRNLRSISQVSNPKTVYNNFMAHTTCIKYSVLFNN